MVAAADAHRIMVSQLLSLDEDFLVDLDIMGEIGAYLHNKEMEMLTQEESHLKISNVARLFLDGTKRHISQIDINKALVTYTPSDEEKSKLFEEVIIIDSSSEDGSEIGDDRMEVNDFLALFE